MRRRTRALLICIVLFAAAIWIYSIWSVNDKYKRIPAENYGMGKWVTLDGCRLTEISNTDGYEMQVLGREIVNTDTFLDEYATGQEMEKYLPETGENSPWKPDKVYIVHVKLRNTASDESMERGIDWQPMYLFCRNVVLDFDMQLYAFANRGAEGSSVLSLKPGTEMEFYLPYGIYEELLGNDAGEIAELPLDMVLCLWPVMKTVRLK